MQYVNVSLSLNSSMCCVSQEQDDMFIILSAVLNLGNVGIESNDEGEATVASGPGTPIRAVAVSTVFHALFIFALYDH